MSRRAYLILGAESTGTRFVTSIFRAAGCMGKSSASDNWQQWDETPPTLQHPIVWRRSFPHGARWRMVSEMMRYLGDYDVQAVVMTRDPYCVRRSQAGFRNLAEIEGNIHRAYPLIFQGLGQYTIPYVMLPYEAFIGNYEAVARWLLDFNGLPSEIELPPFVNANAKWYPKEEVDEPDAD